MNRRSQPKVDIGRRATVLAGAGALAGLALIAGARTRRRRRPAIWRYRFNPRYRETIRLDDGTCAQLRLIRPGDKRLLAEGMRSLSEESRYRRFHVPKRALSEQELRYLTETDGVNHVAIGAVRRGGRGDGLGIARCVRSRTEPDVAEAAIAVRDDLRRRGLGSELFARLMAAAAERGISTLRCDVLAANSPALRFFEQLAPGSPRRLEAGVVTFEIALIATGD